MEGTAIYSSTNATEEGVDLTQISLRPIDLSDLDDLMLWATDEKVAEFCTWEPYASKEDGINFIQNIASKSLWFRVICLHNRAIGCIDLFSSSSQGRCRDKTAEIGYALGSKYWGKGIATQVVKQVVKAAFTEFPHLERLEALVDLENGFSEGAGEGRFSKGGISQEISGHQRKKQRYGHL
ncbi:hypothetical protein VNO77_12488 [Canavalia gladiata]|uniref:N-acetyltransferase domain-containing protein n=1 Tax=Canavalia gladiata TaxID=3824 RepID=A0AAN9QUF4_CANGL